MEYYITMMIVHLIVIVLQIIYCKRDREPTTEEQLAKAFRADYKSTDHLIEIINDAGIRTKGGILRNSGTTIILDKCREELNFRKRINMRLGSE